jgi:pimeloyl-ACP methyl ester carboxylesterase
MMGSTATGSVRSSSMKASCFAFTASTSGCPSKTSAPACGHIRSCSCISMHVPGRTEVNVPAIADLTLDHVTPARRMHSVPLLFVHGMWGGSWVFHNYLAFAASHGWEAWAVNLPHHGSRPVADLGAVRLEDYARDVDDVLDAIGPAVVIGHSMGGLIAQIVASRRELEATVLIVSAPPPGIALVHWALAWRSLRYLADVLPRVPCPPRRRLRARPQRCRAVGAPRRGGTVRGRLRPRRSTACPRTDRGPEADPLSGARRQRIGRSADSARCAATDQRAIPGGSYSRARPRAHASARARLARVDRTHPGLARPPSLGQRAFPLRVRSPSTSAMALASARSKTIWRLG